MDAVEEVKSRLSIEDVVGEYVQLKRAGRNFKGLSPFTSENTPSFMVSPEKQIWHDFSSGTGGNMFSFIMEVEGLDFRGALELLARKAGVDLDQYNSGRNKDLTKKKERAYEILETATKFYQVQFSKNKKALEYILKDRNFSKKTALEFRIGYSPNTGDALAKYLINTGITEIDLKTAGLATNTIHGLRDMFRGRIMIPLSDANGRVVGFTARILEDIPNSPKYINTAQTVLYDKSRNVYGLHLAKESIRKSGFSVLVEGNLDVIASHQAGVKNVVATAGTALTEMQLKTLQRFSGEVRLAFDQDRAGIQAAERSIPIAAKTGVNLSVISISGGKDPDELIKKDPKLWISAIKEPAPAVDWLINLYESQLDLQTATGKSQFSNIVMKTIDGLEDNVEKEHYIEKVSKIIGVSKNALLSKVDTGTKKQSFKKTKTTHKPTEDIETVKMQSQLLALGLMVPSLRGDLAIVDSSMLIGDEAKIVLDFLKLNPKFSGKPEEMNDLRKVSDYVKMLSLQYETLYQQLDNKELQYEIKILQSRLIEIYVKNQKLILAKEFDSADENKTRSLLERVKSLDLLLKEIQGE